MGILVGCIADDLGGASSLAGLLARSGTAVNLRLGTPTSVGSDDGPGDGAGDDSGDETSGDAEAVAPFEVVALEYRDAPVEEAVAAALTAWRWLAAHGARRCYWRYDLASDGAAATDHVGAVADALLGAPGDAGAGGGASRVTVHALAVPEQGRTVRGGRLLPGDAPPDEGPPRHRPTGPARDDDLVRLLARRTSARVAGLRLDAVREGHEAIAADVERLAAAGVVHVVADAVADLDLVALVRGTASLPLLCGSNAFASHLPALHRVRGTLPRDAPPPARPATRGGRLVLADGRSAAVRAQVADWPAGWPSLRLEAGALAADPDAPRAWLRAALGDGVPVLVHSGVDPEGAPMTPERPGVPGTDDPFEAALCGLAVEAVGREVGQLVVAGDGTASAVARALGVTRLGVGPEIVHGVPWCTAVARGRPLALAMTSGAVEGARLFERAFERLATFDAATAAPSVD